MESIFRPFARMVLQDEATGCNPPPKVMTTLGFLWPLKV
ncbi:hypothetical protein X474_16205 [Dethiosulfatarculus sandiegensis]|uniref:Uncharacterized protein n=1 Tax=Dethiosulfatarculus sandiegensis TaxID=1429043 RepID=A0A0D2JBA8_9BACT|nr:hypothetical protein X474_16205 [Dethiosulfatarculus sandiegensis]